MVKYNPTGSMPNAIPKSGSCKIIFTYQQNNILHHSWLKMMYFNRHSKFQCAYCPPSLIYFDTFPICRPDAGYHTWVVGGPSNNNTNTALAHTLCFWIQKSLERLCRELLPLFHSAAFSNLCWYVPVLLQESSTITHMCSIKFTENAFEWLFLLHALVKNPVRPMCCCCWESQWFCCFPSLSLGIV